MRISKGVLVQSAEDTTTSRIVVTLPESAGTAKLKLYKLELLLDPAVPIVWAVPSSVEVLLLGDETNVVARASVVNMGQDVSFNPYTEFYPDAFEGERYDNNWTLELRSTGTLSANNVDYRIWYDVVSGDEMSLVQQRSTEY